MLAENHGHDAVVERMPHAQVLELCAFHAADFLRSGKARAFQHGRREFARNQQCLDTAVDVVELRRAADAQQRVVELRVNRDSLVGRKRPGRRGPDHDAGAARRQRLQAEAPREVRTIDRRKLHVDRRRRALFVFDLGLRQRRAAIDAPVHGLVALVQVTVADDLRERTQLLGLVAWRQRQVRVEPVAEHAQPDKVLALDVDLLHREIAACLPERLGVELLHLAAAHFFDCVLDRQPVAVPTRHVGRIEAVERARLDDDVLQDLVDGVADVNRAVRVRRTVMQDELRPVLRNGAQLFVRAVLVPPRQHIGLAAGEIGLHRECRLGQVYGVLVVSHGKGLWSGSRTRARNRKY